jgi:hypothetical protein
MSSHIPVGVLNMDRIHTQQVRDWDYVMREGPIKSSHPSCGPQAPWVQAWGAPLRSEVATAYGPQYAQSLGRWFSHPDGSENDGLHEFSSGASGQVLDLSLQTYQPPREVLWSVVRAMQRRGCMVLFEWDLARNMNPIPSSASPLYHSFSVKYHSAKLFQQQQAVDRLCRHFQYPSLSVTRGLAVHELLVRAVPHQGLSTLLKYVYQPQIPTPSWYAIWLKDREDPMDQKARADVPGAVLGADTKDVPAGVVLDFPAYYTHIDTLFQLLPLSYWKCYLGLVWLNYISSYYTSCFFWRPQIYQEPRVIESDRRLILRDWLCAVWPDESSYLFVHTLYSAAELVQYHDYVLGLLHQLQQVGEQLLPEAAPSMKRKWRSVRFGGIQPAWDAAQADRFVHRIQQWREKVCTQSGGCQRGEVRPIEFIDEGIVLGHMRRFYQVQHFQPYAWRGLCAHHFNAYYSGDEHTIYIPMAFVRYNVGLPSTHDKTPAHLLQVALHVVRILGHELCHMWDTNGIMVNDQGIWDGAGAWIPLEWRVKLARFYLLLKEDVGRQFTNELFADIGGLCLAWYWLQWQLPTYCQVSSPASHTTLALAYPTAISPSAHRSNTPVSRPGSYGTDKPLSATPCPKIIQKARHFLDRFMVSQGSQVEENVPSRDPHLPAQERKQKVRTWVEYVLMKRRG